MAKMVDHARRVLAHQQAQTEGGEADEAELPEALPADPAFLAPLASSYTIRKRVTVPVLPFPVGATYVFRILEAVRTSKVDDAKFGPAQVCQIESPRGEVRVLIVTKVLATALAREYPDDSYVGGWFQVTKLPAREDKRYADYSITEIDPPVLTEAAA